MVFTAIMFLIFRNYLPLFFTTDPAVIDIAANLLLIAALFQLFDGAQAVGLGILRGLGDVNVPTVLTFFAYWVIGIPTGYLLGIKMNLGIEGIWYGLTLGLLVSSLLLLWRYRQVLKKLEK